MRNTKPSSPCRTPTWWVCLHTRATWFPPPQNKHAMQRALLRNGDRLSARVMVGVKPLDPEDSVAVQAHVGSSGEDSTSFAVAVPKLQQTRPYTVGSAAVAGSMLPLASKGLSQRVKEFILGC